MYHPVVPYAGIIYAIFMISHTVEKAERLFYRHKGIKDGNYPVRGLKFREWYLYGAMAVILINVTIRNIIIFLT